ncbi:MAG: hypothetical protein ACT6RD_10440 [Brevundimonas sp.]|uniref:hypothetical protein n=1 Tax=Brevundimonas sp. TaxID=1871086 RepID=UPI00403413FF
MTDRDIAKMRPAREAMPAATYARLTGASEVALKLPASTIQAFAEEGEDWRERMADALIEAERKKHAA